ncbi:Stearoyl-CoA desaturase 5 [Tupaia chinensis]|uniref:Stearoyl-CoA desaturase 5 n=1 Tax=Tupaia chinensis TaxID=246437 RepID=L9KMB3_TUPCH|nr:Stearoyl-CoA desaturase 5 [Tupaia chinensis]
MSSSLLLLPPDGPGGDSRRPSFVEPQVLQGQAAYEDISGCRQLHGFPALASFPNQDPKLERDNISSACREQNDIFEWCRDHRVHHKYSETDADPHNARRGFFFSHIGWLFVRKHRDVIEKGRKLDFTDLLADPVVRFQRKYYKITVVLMCFAVPTLVPWYIWGESLWNSYFLASILRYTISLNVTWLVNSAAHMYGNRPYNKHISPRQNPLVTLGAIGEYYKITVVLMCFAVPTLVPWYIWGESLWNSYFLASILRYTISLNVTWLVNSAAHMYGNRPYNKHISPRQNPLVTLGAIGEGFHNYHHTFPFDYSASEFGLNFNPTTWFIDFMCWLGLATDRKRAPKPMIEAQKARTGDGSA